MQRPSYSGASLPFQAICKSLLGGALFFLLFLVRSNAQEQLGWHMQQHAGINSISLNPARMAIFPYNWDVNLVEANFFGANNYGFIEQTNWLQLLQNASTNSSFYFRGDITDGAKIPADSYVFDFYDLKRKGYALLRTEFMGPSFSFKINDRHSVGFFSRARFWTGTQTAPRALSYYPFFQAPNFQDINLTPFNASVLGWSELGLNYSVRLPMPEGSLSIGISVKSLSGYEAGYIESEKAFDIYKINKDSIAGSDFILSGALTTSNLKEDNYELQRNGGGLGFDLGLLYTLGEYDDYSWLLGFSLLDLGRISFSENAESHRIIGEQEVSLGSASYNDINGPEDILNKIRLFSFQALGDSTASLGGNSFVMWTPSALSLQIDRNFGRGLYLGATFMQGAPLSKKAPGRGSLLALTPRIEKKWYALSLPISIYNWNMTQVGLSARLGFLVLGTDNLGSWLTKNDLAGGDFYLALKVPFFQKPSSQAGRNKNRGNRKKGGDGCYQF